MQGIFGSNCRDGISCVSHNVYFEVAANESSNMEVALVQLSGARVASPAIACREPIYPAAKVVHLFWADEHGSQVQRLPDLIALPGEACLYLFLDLGWRDFFEVAPAQRLRLKALSTAGWWTSRMLA